MSYKLVIAEKPSVAQSITKMIGADKREDRYLEGNRKLKERRSTGRVATADGADAGRTRPERPDYREIENAARRIADLEREVKQR